MQFTYKGKYPLTATVPVVPPRYGKEVLPVGMPGDWHVFEILVPINEQFHAQTTVALRELKDELDSMCKGRVAFPGTPSADTNTGVKIERQLHIFVELDDDAMACKLKYC